MVNGKSGVWVLLFIAFFTASALGCAASLGVPKYIKPADLSSLAGTWGGWVVLPSGDAFDATITISPNGSYVVRGGAFSATGNAVVKDGNLLITSTSTTGFATEQRTSTASLSQRSDGTLVLNGFGHADAGPFNFLITRSK